MGDEIEMDQKSSVKSLPKGVPVLEGKPLKKKEEPEAVPSTIPVKQEIALPTVPLAPLDPMLVQLVAYGGALGALLFMLLLLREFTLLIKAIESLLKALFQVSKDR
jgi:hypothetical protein